MPSSKPARKIAISSSLKEAQALAKSRAACAMHWLVAPTRFALAFSNVFEALLNDVSRFGILLAPIAFAFKLLRLKPGTCSAGTNRNAPCPLRFLG
jgi:hypothetical protein